MKAIKKVIFYIILFFMTVLVPCLFILIAPLWLIAYILNYKNIEKLANGITDSADNIVFYAEEKLC